MENVQNFIILNFSIIVDAKVESCFANKKF